jgi:hypothetical protein
MRPMAIVVISAIAVLSWSACTGLSPAGHDRCNTDDDCLHSFVCTADGFCVSFDSGVDISTDSETGAGVETDTAIDTSMDGQYMTMDGGYFRSGPLHGYAWTAPVGAGTVIEPVEFSGLMAGDDFCASGAVAAGYANVALLGLNLLQDEGERTPMGILVPPGDGFYVSLTNHGRSTLRLLMQDALGNSWCAVINSNPDYISWSRFNMNCWDNSGAWYDGEPVEAVAVVVPGALTEVLFNFCIKELHLLNVDRSLP